MTTVFLPWPGRSSHYLQNNVPAKWLEIARVLLGTGLLRDRAPFFPGWLLPL
jgi:hypothetical protein